ncbi:hypothetical protein CFIO01_13034 [Colletotrichum fioriniae PJ7]|uniref:Uncharacterized protein n=1 Tax=Colletotrichum fioriniae PJ7 TaxID=1445577 RepID=A0A010RF00_9PEZI|nr:hypothetical protein CFIO01_13034 [Colletotrichum fioriniae PJ7]
MHVIDEAPADPPVVSTRRRAVVLFLKLLDLAVYLRAYHECDRVDSGHVRITRTLQQNGSLLEAVSAAAPFRKIPSHPISLAERGTYFAGQWTDRLSSPGLKEHGKIQVPEPLSSGAELPANEVKKNSRVWDAEFQSSTMSKCESIAPLKASRDRQKKKICNTRVANVTNILCVEPNQRQEFVRRKWPTGESDGSGRGGLSIQVLCYSPCSDNRVNHLEEKWRQETQSGSGPGVWQPLSQLESSPASREPYLHSKSQTFGVDVIATSCLVWATSSEVPLIMTVGTYLQSSSLSDSRIPWRSRRASG